MTSYQSESKKNPPKMLEEKTQKKISKTKSPKVIAESINTACIFVFLAAVRNWLSKACCQVC